jgi:hypothetical protein
MPPTTRAHVGGTFFLTMIDTHDLEQDDDAAERVDAILDELEARRNPACGPGPDEMELAPDLWQLRERIGWKSSR